jgi:hypothetical protein
MDRVHGLWLMSLRASSNDGRRLPDRWLGLNQVNHYSWSNLHCRSRSGWLGATLAGGAALRSAVQPARSGGSPEVAVYGAPNLSFQWGFHLRHWGDVKKLLCSPCEDVGQQWQLVSAGRLDASSASMTAGSGAPPARPRAPAWASVFRDPSGTVDLARAVAHQPGGELNTTARVSIFANQNSPYNGHYI